MDLLQSQSPNRLYASGFVGGRQGLHNLLEGGLEFLKVSKARLSGVEQFSLRGETDSMKAGVTDMEPAQRRL